MMQTRMLLGLAVLSLFICSLASPLSVYAANHEQTKAEKFIEIAQRAYEEAVNRRDQAMSSGMDVADCNSLIEEGKILLDAANESLASGDYEVASENGKEAQVKFRDAIKVLGTFEGESEDDEDQGLLVAIGRAEERIQRLESVVAGIATSEYVDWVNGNLSEAKNNLVAAKAALETGDVDTAAKSHATANKDIEEAFKALKLIGDWTVEWRAQSFLNGITKQLEDAEAKIDEAESKGADAAKVDELRGQTASVADLIENAKTKLLDGDKKGAQEDIQQARDILHDINKELSKLNRPAK